MVPPRQVHRTATRGLSAAMVLIGLAMIVRSLAASTGSPVLGLILGVLFVAAGLGRLWVLRRDPR